VLKAEVAEVEAAVKTVVLRLLITIQITVMGMHTHSQLSCNLSSDKSSKF